MDIELGRINRLMELMNGNKNSGNNIREILEDKYLTNWTGQNKGVLAIRRIFSLVDMITKPKFSNCPKVFKI